MVECGGGRGRPQLRRRLGTTLAPATAGSVSGSGGLHHLSPAILHRYKTKKKNQRMWIRVKKWSSERTKKPVRERITTDADNHIHNRHEIPGAEEVVHAVMPELAHMEGNRSRQHATHPLPPLHAFIHLLCLW
jgi:hypothetical protein